MFTGIVQTTGKLMTRTSRGQDARLVIEAAGIDVGAQRIGDSISVSGVCLTMLNPVGNQFEADVSAETLSLTTLGELRQGDLINLELALTLADRLGGHLVTGHVDGVAKLVARLPDGRSERFDFELPATLSRYVARKGSVCVDGVSLTVNEVEANRFSVCLIPHTLEVTTLGGLAAGDRVNIEVDLIARYLERLQGSAQSGPDGA